MSGEALQDFYTKLEVASPKAAILSVTEPYASQRKLEQESKDLPDFLTDIYKEENKKLSLEDLKKINVDFSITYKQQECVFLETFTQSKKNSWFKFRAGRITASKFKSVVVTSLDKPSISVIKNICYPVKVNFKSAAIKWELDHEKDAFEVYKHNMKDQHQNFTVVSSGLYISTDKPIFAAAWTGFL